MSHGKSFSRVRTNSRFDEDWDVLLSESSLRLLRLRVLVVRFEPCSDDSVAFDDRNAVISITRAITRGDRNFAFQDGGQAFLIALHHGYLTWFHVSPIKQNQYGSE